MAKHRIGDVVILLPGILGSVLTCDGKEVWAPSPGAAMRALLSFGRSVKDLALTTDPWEVDDLGDGVEATRLVNDLHVIPGLWGIDGYTSISRFITDHFDVEPGRTYIEFPYDWRRDNRVAARRLRALADEKLHAVRATNPDAKLVLIGHSMGGLVARYFLECLDGWKDTRTLVTFGTPHRGSLNALDFVANGFVKKIGPLKLVDLTELVHSLTSVYQLLPIYPCVDAGAGYQRVAELPPEFARGILTTGDLERARTALAGFHRAIEAGVACHDPHPYTIHSVVGITQGTLQSAHVVDGRLVVEEHYGGDDMGGDGTVPRVSSTPIETDDMQPPYQPMYSGDRHASLQNADPVQTQLLGVLTARELGGFREVRGLRLEADEIVAVDEPLDARVLPDRGNLDLVATVVSLATGREVGGVRPLRRDADDVHHLTVEPLPAGDYRLTVRGTGSSAELADLVHGVFCVVDDIEQE
jgi:pimeloyl-ACP methyl ester carboxylesterase